MTIPFSKKKLRHAIIMASLISLIAVFADITGMFGPWERKTMDMRTKLCRSDTWLTGDIAIILVDDVSLMAMNDIAGRWPWARFIHGELIDYLTVCGVKSIVMDITFFANQIDPLSESKTINPDDAKLAESTLNAGNVIHALEFTEDTEDEVNKSLLDRPLPEDVIHSFALDPQVISPVSSFNMYYLPFPELLSASHGLGVVTFSPDPDGFNRSEQVLFNYHDHYFPSHALAPVLVDGKYNAIVIDDDSVILSGDDNPVIRIPVGPDHKYYANMYGRYNTFAYSGVIESWMKLQQGITDGLMVPPEELQGKIVYVGTSAAATQDLKNTSIGMDVPGVFLHASICGNILTGDFLTFTGTWANMLILIPVMFLCMYCIFFMRKIYLQIYLPMGLVLIYIGLAVFLFRYNIVIRLALPLTTLLVAYFLSFTYLSFTEGKEKRKVKNILGQYVSPAMLSQVIEHNKEDYLKAEVGSKEYLTVFFSDIRGFTTISEQYPVEKVVEVLNDYLSEMVDIIFDNDGTLDKFIGDAIVAFWGAPVRFDDHSYKAVVSALSMIKTLGSLNERNREKGLPELSIGIGIHTDHVILGNIGSRKKLDYTVIGDGVNLTSRLEGLTKNYGCPIIISQSCYDHINDRVCCRIADYVKVKGKNEPIRIYHAMGLYESIDPWEKTLAEKTTEAFGFYQDGQFEKAKHIYDSILQTDPEDGLARLFSSRCDDLVSAKPDGEWDGCFVHKTK